MRSRRNKNSAATKMTQLSKAAVAPVTNGVNEEHDAVSEPLPQKKLQVNGVGVPRQNAAKGATRKRKGLQDKDIIPTKKSRADRSEQESDTKILPKADIPSKATAKRQKVAFNLPSLPTASGVIFVIGDNAVGQLGLSEDIAGKKRPFKLDIPAQFVDIAAGGMHSVCLTDKGEVYTFGCNDEGALGRFTDDEEGSEYIPRITNVPGIVVKVTAGDSHSAALTKEGHVYIWGNFRCNEGFIGLTAYGVKQTSPIRILNNVEIIDISSGSDHLVCLSSQGTVYTCGCGEVGQLGRVSERTSKGTERKGYDSLLTPDSVRVAIQKSYFPINSIWTGSYSTYIRAKESGEIYAFGLNNYNQLGYENELTTFRPKKVTSFSSGISWRHISGGQHHTLALDEQGQMYSLGRKEYGRLGLGEETDEKSTPTSIPLLEGKKCIHASSGNVVSFSVTERGCVYSWGMGTNYQLGHGNDNDCHVPRLIEGELLNSWHVLRVSGGGQHTLLLAKRKTKSEDKADSKSEE